MPIHFPLIVAQAIDTSAGTDTFHEMVQGVCGFIRPIVDKGNVVSLLLVMVVLVMAFLWYVGRSPEDLGGVDALLPGESVKRPQSSVCDCGDTQRFYVSAVDRSSRHMRRLM